MRRILFERGICLGIELVELLARKLSGALHETYRGGLAGLRNLLRRPLGDVSRVFSHLGLRVFHIAAAVVIQFAGALAGNFPGFFPPTGWLLIGTLLPGAVPLPFNFLFLPLGRL